MSEAGPHRVAYVEMQAWASMNEIDVQDWELTALRRMDAAFIAAMRTETKRNSNT